MQSLSDLNGYSATEIEVTDDRLAKVLFDRSEPTLQEINITSASVVVPQGFEIEEIINYSTALARYEIKIQSTSSSFISGSTITFPTLPTGVTQTTSSSTFEKTFTLSGLRKVSDWDAVKAATWTLWASYAGVDTFNLEVSVVYYDEELGSDVRFAYQVYDPDYYYDAKLDSEFSLAISSLGVRNFSIAMETQFAMFTDTLDGRLESQSSLACQGVRVKLGNATLASTATETVSITGVRRFVIAMSSTASVTAIPTSFKTYYMAMNSYTASGTDALYGVNYFKFSDTITKIPDSAWSTNNYTAKPVHKLLIDDTAAGIVTSLQTDAINRETYIRTYDLNSESPQASTPNATVPRTAGMISSGNYYYYTDIATGRVTDTYFAVVAAGVNASQVMLYDKATMTLQQNLAISYNGNPVDVYNANWDSTGTYLTVSYNAYSESSAQTGFQAFKRSGSTLTLIDTEQSNSGLASFGITPHAVSDNGQYVYLAGRYATTPSDYARIDFYSRSGDTYTVGSGYNISGAKQIHSITHNGGFLAVVVRTSDAVPYNGYIQIYTIGTGGALTARAQIPVIVPPRSEQTNICAWTPDSLFLMYGSGTDATSTPGLVSPLRVWSRATYTFTEETVNYGGEGWPSTGSYGNFITGMAAYRST